METTASKRLSELSLEETKGLVINILRDEFGYKWDYISKIMGIPRSTSDRYYRKFKHIYSCTENEKVMEANGDPGNVSLSSTQSQEEVSDYEKPI